MGVNLYAYAAGDPIDLIDPLGLAYSTPEAAAMAALCNIYPTSYAENAEYGGRIVSTPAGITPMALQGKMTNTILMPMLPSTGTTIFRVGTPTDMG
jgi:hypothetical protein